MAQRNDLIEDLAPEYVDKGFAILQHADDTILCLKEDMHQAANLKLQLYMYEVMSGLKINFSKSEVMMVRQEDSKNVEFSNMFNCTIGKWPIKYLGVPLLGSKLHVADWLPIGRKCLSNWMVGKEVLLSLGGRFCLRIRSLGGLPQPKSFGCQKPAKSRNNQGDKPCSNTNHFDEDTA